MATTVTIPNVAGAETITGPWTFTGTLVVPTRTRRIFIPAGVMAQIEGTAMALTEIGTYPGSWMAWPMVTGPAAAPQAVGAHIGVPNDYDSGGTFFVVYSQSGVSVVLWRCEVNYLALADGGDPTAASSVVAVSITPDGVTNRVQVDQIGAVPAPLTAGGWVRFAVERDSAHADDTNPDTIRLMGVYLEYTSRY